MDWRAYQRKLRRRAKRREIVHWLLMALAVSGLAVLAMGCVSPTAPSVNGMFLCFTQPRVYTSPAGVQSIEVDHYVQSTPCPTVPIK